MQISIKAIEIFNLLARMVAKTARNNQIVAVKKISVILNAALSGSLGLKQPLPR
jgi:hypothetical protein